MSKQNQDSGDKVQAIRQQISDDLLASADELGMDAESIIETQVSENAKYGLDTIARFAETAIEREVEAAHAEEVKGIIMGSRDRYDRNWPRRHSLVKSDGDHLEVSTWDGSLPAGDGTEREIPTGGALVSMEVDYEEEYDSYQGRRLTGVKEYDAAELVENLSKVAIPPSDLTASDEYETVVVRGTLRYVNAQTIFKDGEPSGDGQILMEDDRGQLQPHFEVVLDSDDGSRFRGHVERQSYGRPFFRVPDLMNLATDAYERYEEPSRQADFVGDGLHGVDVIIVGNVNSFDRDRNDDGEPITYVDVGVTAMVATDTHTLGDFEAEATSEEDDEADAGDEPEPEGDVDVDTPDGTAGGDSIEAEGVISEADYADDLQPIASELDAVAGNAPRDEMVEGLVDELGADELVERIESGDGSGGESDPETASGDVAEVAGLIDGYEDITGEELETVAEVREHIGDVDDSIDDVVIRAALGDGSAQDDAEGGEETVEDILEPLLEGGTYGCPVGDCLASEGSAANILIHTKDEHGIESENPLEHARELVEA